jgi:hypothetical protein
MIGKKIHAIEKNGVRDEPGTLTVKSWTELASLADDSAAPIVAVSKVQMVYLRRGERMDGRKVTHDNTWTENMKIYGNCQVTSINIP